jgi:hypothetical protein
LAFIKSGNPDAAIMMNTTMDTEYLMMDLALQMAGNFSELRRGNGYVRDAIFPASFGTGLSGSRVINFLAILFSI